MRMATATVTAAAVARNRQDSRSKSCRRRRSRSRSSHHTMAHLFLIWFCLLHLFRSHQNGVSAQSTTTSSSSSSTTTTSNEDGASKNTVHERPPPTFTPQQQQQLLQLEQAIASSADPQQTLQQVAQSNQLSAQDLIDMFQQNRMQLQQSGGGGGGHLLPRLAKKTLAMVVMVLTQIVTLVWRVLCKHPTLSSVMTLLALTTAYILLMARPYNGWMISHPASQGPTAVWIPPPKFIQHQVWNERPSLWQSREDLDLSPWSIPTDWLQSSSSHEKEQEDDDDIDDNDETVPADGIQWHATVPQENIVVEDDDNVDDVDDDTAYPMQSAVIVQKTITMEDITRGAKIPTKPRNHPIKANGNKSKKTNRRHDDDEHDKINNTDEEDRLDDNAKWINVMFRAAITIMKGPLRWTAATESSSSLPFSLQLVSEPLDVKDDDDEDDEEEANDMTILQQQQQQPQRALVLLPQCGDWNRCALQPFWMIPNQHVVDEQPDHDDDDNEDNDKEDIMESPNQSRISFVTCPRGHWDGQVQCVLQANPETGHLTLRLYVLIAKESSSSSTSSSQQRRRHRNPKRLQQLTTVMAERWMQAWYDTLLPVLQQQYVRQQQSRHFASRYHEKALKRRHLRQHVAEQLEEMAADRRRKWQRNNPNAGHWRPTGPRVPHFSGSTSAVTTI